MWIALYDDVTGRLVSLGTRISENPKDLEGLGTFTLDSFPDSGLMWDEFSRSYIPRPPKIRPDYASAIFTHPALDTLTPTDRQSLELTIRAALADL